MGHATPTVLVLLTAVPLATAVCAPSPPYYISLPSHTCVNDGEHASQGPGPILLYDTKEACCNGLAPKERRECLKPEVLSEVYPDFEKGRCASDTLRPAVVHPACGVTAAGATTFVVARFLKASLRVSDNEFCCRDMYGGLGEAAVGRCLARRGTWYYVDGMGCVRDDARADDPVVYSTARTVGSLSACTKSYFPRDPVVMCDTFSCPGMWTNRPDRDSIHCGASHDDCTKELCCTAPAVPPPPGGPAVMCDSVDTCTPKTNSLMPNQFLTAKSNPELRPCPSGICTPYDCCDVYKGEIAPPPCEGEFSTTLVGNRVVVHCPAGKVPDIAFTLKGSLAFLHESEGTGQLNLIGAYDVTSQPNPETFTHRSANQILLFIYSRVAADGYLTVKYTCVSP